jgi:hypothetical protein
VQRACDLCGEIYEAKRATSRFCKPAHRKAWATGARPTTDLPAAAPDPADEAPTLPKVSDQLARELDKLKVLDTYEAAIALGLAKQLDSRVITGTAYTSLSKELDRRVDALRLKAERPDDPVAMIRGQLDEHRLQLVEGSGA